MQTLYQWMLTYPFLVLCLGTLPALWWCWRVWPMLVGPVRVVRVPLWRRSMRRLSGYIGEQGPQDV